MKKLISVWNAIFLAMVVHAGHASPASPSPAAGTVEAKLVSLTNEWTAAILAKDRRKLESLIAPDYRLQRWDGSWQVERAPWMENTMGKYEIAEYHHSDVVPHVYDVAAITSKWYWRGQREKKPFEEHGYVLDVWRRSGDRWQVASRITIILPGKEDAFTK